MENHDRGKGRGRNGQFVKTLGGAERDAEAARLRSTGLGLRQIADTLGYESESGASKAISRALAAVPAEAVNELRLLESARLDQLLAALQPGVGDGNVQAIAEARKISESRRRLFGLDGPVSIDLNVGDPRDLELRELVAETKARILFERQAADDGP